MSIEGEFVSDESLRLEECFANLASDNISIEELKAISQKTAVPLRRVECFALDKGLTPLRYQRNIGTVGVSGQIRLLESTVMLVGLGGLGGNILEQIVRAGFGTIIGVDPDIIPVKNRKCMSLT